LGIEHHAVNLSAGIRVDGAWHPDKGLMLRYLKWTTGYSRQQLTRLAAASADRQAGKGTSSVSGCFTAWCAAGSI
jgi:hypothetical protein